MPKTAGFALVALAVLQLGCGDSVRATVDAGSPRDSSRRDAGAAAIDAASGNDAAAVDGGSPEEGFGTIAGPCGRVALELDEVTPSLLQTYLDFSADSFDDPEERDRLTPGAQQILTEGTAGGSSGISEAFAYEVLARCEGASLLKTERFITYEPVGTLTDILVRIDGMMVGVSVTRAFLFPPSTPYTVEAAETLLADKLADVLESSANVSDEDRWVKQILTVVAYADMHAESIRTAWDALDSSLQADTIVYVIVTDGADAPLY